MCTNSIKLNVYLVRIEILSRMFRSCYSQLKDYEVRVEGSNKGMYRVKAYIEGVSRELGLKHDQVH